jgi:hypothetical protein
MTVTENGLPGCVFFINIVTKTIIICCINTNPLLMMSYRIRVIVNISITIFKAIIIILMSQA